MYETAFTQETHIETMAEPPSSHSADEAGGEAIYTSDGLPALIAPLPPPPLNNDGRRRRRRNHRHHLASADNNDNDNDISSGEDDADNDDLIILEEELLDPRMAFQAFSRHLPPTNAAGWILNRPTADTTTTTDNDDDDVDVEHDGIRLTWPGKEENPSMVFLLQRLHRLKAEMDILETALNNTTNTTESNDDNNNNNNNDDTTTNFKSMMIELKSRIDALRMTQHSSSSSAASFSARRRRQEYLSRIIADKTIDEKKTMMVVHDLYRRQEQHHQDQHHHQQQLQKKEEENVGGDVSIHPSSTTSSSLTIQQQHREASLLEERLRRLENVMGYNTTANTTTTTTNKSILERIEEAERLTREMTDDGKQLEKLAAKAKVIRADLEAAARAKTKLGNSSSYAKPSSSSSTTTTTTTTAATAMVLEDSQVISKLHAQLIELDGISTHLPALTLRLLELSNLHNQASEFGSRLTELELAVGRSERVLLSVEEALTKMEDGWKENTSVLERNVKKLDDMMLRLLGGGGGDST